MEENAEKPRGGERKGVKFDDGHRFEWASGIYGSRYRVRSHRLSVRASCGASSLCGHCVERGDPSKTRFLGPTRFFRSGSVSFSPLYATVAARDPA